MKLFDVSKKKILVTGGTGVLGKSIAEHLLKNGASVIILARNKDKVAQVVDELSSASEFISGVSCDVLDEACLNRVCNDILEKHGSLDVLINVAGGNRSGATIREDQTIFDININDFKSVVDLNLLGSVLPSIVFGKVLADNNKGVIINTSSMAAQRAISRVVGYSASKAAIDNFTKWLSVELALKFGDGLRVNAIAPGFFIGNQNRRLLINEDGSFTERGKVIINNTPMKRFGLAEEINGTIQYLCSDASKFVSGVVIPIDGGFNAYSGV